MLIKIILFLLIFSFGLLSNNYSMANHYFEQAGLDSAPEDEFPVEPEPGEEPEEYEEDEELPENPVE